MLKKIVTWPSSCTRWVGRKLFGKGEVGASLVEYALLLALIAVVAVGALFALGNGVKSSISNTTTCLTTVNGKTC